MPRSISAQWALYLRFDFCPSRMFRVYYVKSQVPSIVEINFFLRLSNASTEAQIDRFETPVIFAAEQPVISSTFSFCRPARSKTVSTLSAPLILILKLYT
ncbi:hypothetical protein L6452_06018 [Arctium lappa]|uniref:Uncharacterized protein n=1 Tax=Arctium lappa TaxID=4217 RepID=A0ACB9EI93_ARCLA|nr:hypothetical protein L6452_06018 [Arctium lappa]